METIITVLTKNIIVLLAAIMLLGISAYLFINTRKFVSAATKTKGTIVRLDPRPGSKGGTVYLPFFEFRTLDGQVHTVAHDSAQKPPQYKVGQSIDVLYNPENPQDAKISGSTNLYLLPVILAVGGVVASIAFCRILTEELFK